MRLQNNLTNMLALLGQHRITHPDCGNRFQNGSPAAAHQSPRIPLSHSTPRQRLKEIWRDGALRSRRLSNGGNPPRNVDGTVPAEVILGTDNDVFLFVGPIRYFCPNIAGMLFSPSTEIDFMGDMVATPFDSGGLVRHFTQRVAAASLQVFLAENELPVPNYRNYLSEFMASLFDSPAHYFLRADAALCEEPIVVTGGNACLRRSFEVRFREQLPLRPHLLALFLNEVVATEPWAKAIAVECKRLGAGVHYFDSEDGREYGNIVQATKGFIEGFLR